MKKFLATLIILISSIGLYHYLKPQKISPYIKYASLIPNTYRIGFTDLNREVSIDSLELVGEFPKWLSGTLFRNGPAKFNTPNSWVSNWFDGLAMIHAFSFNDGRVSYANKFLISDDYLHVQRTGSMNYAGFMQDPCKKVFKNLFAYFFPQEKNRSMPNANVNIAKFTDKLVALTEVPLPIIFDANSLTTTGPMHHYDGLPEKNIQTTAHPHYDPIRKEHLGYFINFARKSSYNLYSIADGSTKRKIIASIETDRPSYMHSFGITDNYAILTALPLVVNPLDLVIMRKAFIKNFKWRPELGTQLIVINRINGKFVVYKTEPFFAFHVVNAFEVDKNNIAIDVVTFSNAKGIEESTLDKILGDQVSSNTTETGTLKRFNINLTTNTVTSKILTQELIELPRINYDKFNGKDYTYVYAYAKSKDFMNAAPYVADKLVKVNVKTGQVLSWQSNKAYPGEPVFVASPDGESEDAGVVLSVVLDTNKAVSCLLVLDAKDFKEIARAYVPHHIPFGIHGAYFR